MADIKIIDPLTNKEIDNKPQEIKPHAEITGAVIPDLQIKAIAEVMGLDSWNDTTKYSDRIDTLLEWAKTQTKDHSTESLKSKIRELESKIGSPPLAEKKINYVSRYAYLELETQKIDKEKAALRQQGRMSL